MKVGRGSIRLLLVAALGASLAMLLPRSANRVSAFEIGGCAALTGIAANVPHCGLPVHEEITEAAIRAVTPAVSQGFLTNVKHGVQNTDFTHQFESQFHFDNSNSTNNGFNAGFSNIVAMLHNALQEASLCEPTCVRNPQFFNPIHQTFTGIADDIVGTMQALAADPSCLAEPACPSTLLVADAAAITAEVLPTRADASPDPDRTAAKIIGDVRYKVAEVLGKHCDVTGRRCVNSLDDMLTDRSTFRTHEQQLRTLQRELQAYFAWQHLGHAFHSVQDFFAHSNYVELAMNKNGPPCATSQFQANLCDSEITGAVDAVPIPTGSAAMGVSTFADVFSATGFRQILGLRFDRLESGYYVTPQPLVCTAQSGLHYCHYTTSTAIGLNKDRPFASGDADLSHKNHAYARSAATRASVMLWTAFLHDLPPDAVVAAGHPREVELDAALGPVNPKTHKATVTIKAYDSQSKQPLKGDVLVLASNKTAQATGSTGTAISFTPCKEFDPELKHYVGDGACTVRVTVVGYAVATTSISVP